MTLHESIDNLFKNINSLSLKEATLSRDIFKYSGKSKQELKSLVHSAETCIRSFEAKYSFENRDTISETKRLTYYDDYHGHIAQESVGNGHTVIHTLYCGSYQEEITAVKRSPHLHILTARDLILGKS